MDRTVVGVTYWELQQQYKDALSQCVNTLGPGWDVRWLETGGVTWCQFARTVIALPNQGWKIHVSASASEAVGLCRSVLSWVLSERIPCKIAGNISSILRINSGAVGESQTGKVLTVYPSDDTQAAKVAVEIDHRWNSTAGPAVPSDLALRPNGAVFLRYGGFASDTLVDRFGKVLPAVRQADGTLVEDYRSTDGTQPTWATPPLLGLTPALSEWNGPFKRGQGQDAYLPLQLLHASPKGKVFLGLSIADVSEVLIKIARRGVGGVPRTDGRRP